MAYMSRTGTKRNIAAAKKANWGWMVGPLDMGGPVREGMPHACDNGAWPCYQAFLKGKRLTADPDLSAFQASIARHGATADFIVIPDVVQGGNRSWAMTRYWMRRLRRDPRFKAVKLLIAVQDGFTPEMIAPFLSARIGIFIGGSTEWKLKTMREWGKLARSKGSYCHCGRVNTERRIDQCGASYVDSIDGSSGTRFAVTIPPLARAVRNVILKRSQMDIDDILDVAA